MYFHHLHFYVKDSAVWQQWFNQKLSFQTDGGSNHARSRNKAPINAPINAPVNRAIKPQTILRQGHIEIRLSDPSQSASVERHLAAHPPGLVDIAFGTNQFDSILEQALRAGAILTAPVTRNDSGNRQCQLQGWAHLRHTLVEVSEQWISEHIKAATGLCSEQQAALLSTIDHVVINVLKGKLEAAVAWYQQVFGLQLGQAFEINTRHSGLRSQVLVHPDGLLQMPLNEPSSENSQIQEFLHHNRGAGVQHVALSSVDAIDAIAHFRAQGLSLLHVPDTYYDTLHQHPNYPASHRATLSKIQQQQLLIDWPQSSQPLGQPGKQSEKQTAGQPGTLLQTFTQPIFTEPTFFFEIIERSQYTNQGQLCTTQGFGEGNFQALFEAIERAQMQRGSLKG
ncbi:MAG: VOC family protein [Cyanobacteria bacterium J06573_11]